MHRLRRASSCAAFVLIALWPICAQPAAAVTNTVVGGIGGLDNGTLLGGDGTGSARVSLNVVDLALVKEARTTRGVPLVSDADVFSEQEIYFVLYVKNPCPQVGSEIQIRDPLDVEAFTFIPNTLQIAIVPIDTTLDACWAIPWQALTDEAGGAQDDEASIGELDPETRRRLITVGATPEQPNRKAYVPPGSLMAVRFRVRVN